MGGGELSVRLTSNGTRDEVGGIITGLNMLAEELEAYIASLHHKVAVLNTLREIDLEIILRSNPQAVIDKVCQRAAELCRAPKSVVTVNYKLGPAVAASGLWNPGFVADHCVYSPFSETDKEQLFNREVSFFDQETVSDLFRSEFVASEKIQAAAMAPVKNENEIFGSLLIFDTEPREWNEDEAELLNILASQTAIALDGYRLFVEEGTRREELGTLYDISRALADIEPQTDKILDLIARQTADAAHVTFVRMVLMEDGQLVTRAAYPVRMIDRDLMSGFTEPAAAAFLQGVMQHDSPVVIRPDDLTLSAAEKRELFLGLAKYICIVPLRNAETCMGLILLGEARQNEREPFSMEKVRLVGGIGNQTVSALRRAALFQELEDSYLATVLSLANAVDAKDTYTGGHGRQLAEMALTLGRELGRDPIELNDLHYGALLHDIGKIGIADSILKKPGSLTAGEWRQIREHPAIGEMIISPAHSLRGAAKIVRYHHERYEGGGYPDHLVGDEIPLGARVLTVVDSFCAMIDQRSYKEAQSVSDAIAELQRCSGTQFDPRIVEKFRELWGEQKIHYGNSR
jgi:HD-GYP domain-containing protein (c-di-GMP phosphodiesterase class II)